MSWPPLSIWPSPIESPWRGDTRVAPDAKLWYPTVRGWGNSTAPFRDRLVVGQLTLDQSTVVRIHVPEPLLLSWGSDYFPTLILRPNNGWLLSTLRPLHPTARGGKLGTLSKHPRRPHTQSG